jgi:hypothetical protein
MLKIIFPLLGLMIGSSLAWWIMITIDRPSGHMDFGPLLRSILIGIPIGGAIGLIGGDWFCRFVEDRARRQNNSAEDKDESTK